MSTTVYLLPTDYNYGYVSENVFGTCFRPDVSGTYTLVLNLQNYDDDCYYDESSPLSITANCDTNPTASFILPTATLDKRLLIVFFLL